MIPVLPGRYSLHIMPGQVVSNITDVFWTFGDGSNTSDILPEKQYKQPGQYNIQLTVEDEKGCRDSLQQVITWKPAPPFLIVTPDRVAGCSPLNVSIKNRSSPVDSTYTVVWEIEEDTIIESIDANPLFQESGIYDIGLSITSPIGCHIDTVFRQLIAVSPAPGSCISLWPQSLIWPQC